MSSSRHGVTSYLRAFRLLIRILVGYLEIPTRLIPLSEWIAAAKNHHRSLITMIVAGAHGSGPGIPPSDAYRNLAAKRWNIRMRFGAPRPMPRFLNRLFYKTAWIYSSHFLWIFRSNTAFSAAANTVATRWRRTVKKSEGVTATPYLWNYNVIGHLCLRIYQLLS